MGMSQQLSRSVPNQHFHISSSGSHFPVLFCAEILPLLVMMCRNGRLPVPSPQRGGKGPELLTANGPRSLLLLEMHPYSHFLPSSPAVLSWALRPTFGKASSVFSLHPGICSREGRTYTTRMRYGVTGPPPASPVRRSIKGTDIKVTSQPEPTSHILTLPPIA